MKTLPDHILFAHALDGKGGSLSLTKEDQVLKKLKADILAWAHVDVNKPEAERWLRENFDYLDDSIVEALTSSETRPRIAEVGEGFLLNLRGVNLNPGAEPEDMVSIRMYVDPHRIITTQRRPLMAVKDIVSKLESGSGPHNAADVMVVLMMRLFQRMEPVILELDEQTDTLEAQILEEPDVSVRKDIIDVRQDAIMLRRYIAPQKDIPAHLRLTDLPWITHIHKRQFQDAQDRLTRYIEDLDAIRERGQIVKDELANALADRMNKNVYILSLITAIFLPLGFLTGLLGINVGGMPGADNDMAFWFVCLMCLGVIALSSVVMKVLKWV